MAFADLSLLGILKTKMNWHQSRQSVLAHNVANADTPDFRPSDLKPMNTRERVRAPQLAGVNAARTHQAHFDGRIISPSGNGFGSDGAKGWETTPGGNSVVLEEQMIKVSANQFDFQVASSLYARSLGLLKTAVGRGR